MKPLYIIAFFSFAVLINGCSLNGKKDKVANVQFSVNRYVLNKDSLKIAVFDNGRDSQNFFNQDFHNTKNFQGSIIATPKINTSTNGILSIKVKLLNSKNEKLLSKGKFKIDLKSNWTYGVYFRIDSVNGDPTRGCLGCRSYFSFKINQKLVDSSSVLYNKSLYAVIGGNSISNPVVY